MLKRRETIREKNNIINKPKIAIGELSLYSSDTRVNDDSFGSMSKKSELFTEIFHYDNIDLGAYQQKRLLTPKVVIGNLTKAADD